MIQQKQKTKEKYLYRKVNYLFNESKHILTQKDKTNHIKAITKIHQKFTIEFHPNFPSQPSLLSNP